ncbi:uncharacterized protein BDZ99DRAFT_404513 [Mytilinidion resinicola]|uniref:DUF7728 domain-containing protein n=1 Tax=Mytilinidion resinicola TaxID=574789 RepID=A0A6A6Z7R4_9PEZI|nr:uncharacterized protein BDZ99DRAFT_404513 [Mytilinidion resinicola]KAF2817106.1 hypothetical protein BDZ99DRAFT_404513 [Mytilinidion resinicola]
MRSFLSLASFFAAGALASHLGSTSEDWRDYTWSYYPENTADELKELGLPLPEIAAPITTVHEHENYVVKLECLGCPFRVREYGQVVEHWQENPQDNSLLFNFSIAEDKRSLLVNGKQIYPLVLPANIYSYQVPANLSADIMRKMVDMRMMDKSWNVGTQYGSFEISFEQTTMMTNERLVQLLQFDITHAEIRWIQNPGVALLNQPKQKLIQLKLSQENMREGLKIKSIELVEQGEKITHAKMPCGKEAPRFTQVFRATEWDYYGHIGTLAWTWKKATGEATDWLFDHTYLLFALVFVLVFLRRRIQQRREAKRAIEDPEAGLLIIEDDEEAAPEHVQDEQQVEPELEKLVAEEKISDEAAPVNGDVDVVEEKKEEEAELTVSDESKPSLLD